MLDWLSLPTIIVVMAFEAIVFFWWLIFFRPRRRMIAGIAIKMRMRFTAHWRAELRDELSQSYCMQVGHWPRIYNVISGRQSGVQFWYCDFSYETGNGGQRKTHNKSIVMCKCKKELSGMIALRNEEFSPIGRYRFYQALELPDWQGPEDYMFYGQGETIGQLLATPRLAAILSKSHYDNCELMGHYLIIFSDRLSRPEKIARMILRSLRCAKLLSS
ncbi:MAG: hypothetical protein JEZ07_19160 [Phycisphaerae bacterium]|nr:hypothetical protein [Phycisphaerae bacterium]